jgi:hypothetical protein
MVCLIAMSNGLSYSVPCLIVYRASHSEPDGKLRTPGRAKWSVSWCSPDATAPRRKAAAAGDHESPRNRKVAPACGVRAGGTACSGRRRQKVCPSVTRMSPENVTRRSVHLLAMSYVLSLAHRGRQVVCPILSGGLSDCVFVRACTVAGTPGIGSVARAAERFDFLPSWLPAARS